VRSAVKPFRTRACGKMASTTASGGPPARPPPLRASPRLPFALPCSSFCSPRSVRPSLLSLGHTPPGHTPPVSTLLPAPALPVAMPSDRPGSSRSHAAGASAEPGFTTPDHSLADSSPTTSFPPTDSGVMRGWLKTHTPEPTRLWFVLSLETLAYYESPEAADAAEPLGMLGIDEMQSVKGACVLSLPRAIFYILPLLPSRSPRPAPPRHPSRSRLSPATPPPPPPHRQPPLPPAPPLRPLSQRASALPRSLI
jgi:hypothetical protein